MRLNRLFAVPVALLTLLGVQLVGPHRAEAAGNTSGKWQLVGPKKPMIDAEGGDVGRITSFTFLASHPGTIYAVTPFGGLWRTQNGGTDWDLLSNLPDLALTDIAVDPQKPDTIYLLTGDGDVVNTFSPPTTGVIKTVDGGKTWSQTGLTFTVEQGVYGHRLVVDPANPSILMAATGAGLFRSTDAGQTWSQVTAGILPIDRQGDRLNQFWDVEFRPADPSTVYAASTTTVYRSADSGQTWTVLRGGLPNYSDLCAARTCALYPNYSVRIRLGVTPANPSVLYVLYGAPTGFTIGLYRSNDGGVTFSKQSSTAPVPNPSKQRNAPAPIRMATPNIFGYNDNDYKSQADYTIAMAISPTNADVVHVGAVDTWQSTNGGRTWARTSRWDDAPDVDQYVHADIHTLAYDGTGLYAATDGGLYRSTDEGKTWSSVSRMTTGITIALTYDVCSIPQQPDVLYYGAQDNGTYRLDISGELEKVAGGDGFVCQIDPRYPDTLYVSWPYGAVGRIDNAQHGYVCAGCGTGATPYTDITPQIGNQEADGSWLTPFILDPKNPDIVYGCYADLWRSPDRGLSWQNLTNGALGSSIECRQVAVSPADSNTIYVAKDASGGLHGADDGDTRTPFLGGGGIYRSSDGGASWQLISRSLPLAEAPVSALAVSPTDAKRAWATFRGYDAQAKVFVTADGGATWTDLSSGLPNDRVLSIAAANDPANGIYIGTDDGVYYRDDRLGKWVPFKTGLPATIVTSLLIQQPQHRVLASTFGRGVWVSGLYSP